MLKEERFQFILNRLSEDQRVTLKSLSKALKVSDYTVRRDLKELTDKGLLKAVRGGAVPHSPTPHHFQDRLNYKSQEKKIIALNAGMTVIRLLPPLVISYSQIDQLVDVLAEVLTKDLVAVEA